MTTHSARIKILRWLISSMKKRYLRSSRRVSIVESNKVRAGLSVHKVHVERHVIKGRKRDGPIATFSDVVPWKSSNISFYLGSYEVIVPDGAVSTVLEQLVRTELSIVHVTLNPDRVTKGSEKKKNCNVIGLRR